MRHLALARLCGNRPNALAPRIIALQPRGGVFAALCPSGTKQTKLRSFDAFKKPSPKLAPTSKRETFYLCCSQSRLSASQLRRRMVVGKALFHAKRPVHATIRRPRKPKIANGAL